MREWVISATLDDGGTRTSTHDFGVDEGVAKRPRGVPREASTVATFLGIIECGKTTTSTIELEKR